MEENLSARRWRDRPLPATLAGALPHLGLAAWILWPRDIYWSVMAATSADVTAQLPAVVFGSYSRAALVVVPVSVMAVAAVALSPRRRTMALWLMLGTLAGATVVFMILCVVALTWQAG